MKMKKYTVRATSYNVLQDEEWAVCKRSEWWMIAMFHFICLGLKYDYVEMQRRK